MSNTKSTESRALALAGREVSAALTSPLAWVFTAVFIAVGVTTFFLVERFFASDQASVRGFFRWMPALLALVAPALTMRSWADEKKLGSYEMLLTLPMRARELVLGKFLGAVVVLGLALVFTLGIPFAAEAHGDLDWGPVLGGYTGSVLLGAAFLAIGLFASALVQDQILALFFGWAMCALALLPEAPFWESLLPSGAASTLKSFGFGARFGAVERGLLDLGDLVFYLSAIFLFLALNVLVLEWRHKKQRWQLLLAAELLLVNLVCAVHITDSLHLWRADLTEGAHYSISPATRDLMADLSEGGEIVFYHSAPENQHEKLRPLIDPLKDLLGEFGAASGGRVKTRSIELDKAGEQAQSTAESGFGVRPFPIPVRDAFQSGYRSTYFSVVISTGTDFEHLNLEQLIRVAERGGTDWEVELGDVEFLTARALKKLARGFGSVPGALVAHGIKADVEVLLTATDTLPEHLKSLRETVQQVGERLTRESAGHFQLRVSDPWEGKSSPEERHAVDLDLKRKHRITPIPRDYFSEDSYHAWAVLKVGDRKEILGLYSAQTALGTADVKTHLEGALKRLIPGFLSLVGFASPKADFDPMMMQMGQRPPPDEFAALQDALAAEYEVRRVNLSGESPEIPREIETVVLARPKELSDKALFELDQFLMRGGKLIMLADNFTLDAEGSGRTGSIEVAPVDTASLRPFLAHFGVILAPELVLDERCDYLPLLKTRQVGRERVRYIEDVAYPYFLSLPRESMAKDHAITRELPESGLFWASPVSLGELPAGVSGRELLHTSQNASLKPDASDVDSVLDQGFKASAEAKSHSLAVTVQGEFTSYFADKPLPGIEKPAGASTDAKSRGAPLAESQQPAHILVVGDSDGFTPTVFRAFQQSEDVFDGNFRLLTNAIDEGGEDSELMALRNRAPVRRPLEGLAQLSPEERGSAAQASFLTTLFGSIAALCGCAMLWWVRRRAQRPIALVERSHS